MKGAVGPEHFLESALARRWVERGDLIPFEFIDQRTLASPRLDFVTFPHEWSDRQHDEAARLTLRLQADANEAGFDLKDASAWNVIYAGTRPVFCDLSSVDRLRERSWWAAGQFARHFIFPRLLARHAGIATHFSFTCWRDGVPAEIPRRVMGWRRFVTRYWPMLVPDQRGTPYPAPVAGAGDEEALRRFRAGLNAWFAWVLRGVAAPPIAREGGLWAGYVDQRGHYAAADIERKRQTVGAWMESVRPSTVLDLGCNTGEFSVMAAGLGVDGDAQAVDRLVRRLDRQEAIHPVIATLDDLVAGRGWAGNEYPGLGERLNGRVDLVLMLALIHHLTIGAAVPIDAVAAWITQFASRWLVIECLSPDDEQVRSLCAQRNRDPAEFSMQAQLTAFQGLGWVQEADCELIAGRRRLVLFRRVPA